MNKEKDWHELRRKVMYSSDIDEEASHWKEIDSELKLLDETRKILSSLTTSDTQKIDKIDLLLSEGGN